MNLKPITIPICTCNPCNQVRQTLVDRGATRGMANFYLNQVAPPSTESVSSKIQHNGRIQEALTFIQKLPRQGAEIIDNMLANHKRTIL